MQHMKLQHGLFINFNGEHIVGEVSYINHKQFITFFLEIKFSKKIIYFNFKEFVS